MRYAGPLGRSRNVRPSVVAHGSRPGPIRRVPAGTLQDTKQHWLRLSAESTRFGLISTWRRSRCRQRWQPCAASRPLPSALPPSAATAAAARPRSAAGCSIRPHLASLGCVKLAIFLCLQGRGSGCIACGRSGANGRLSLSPDSGANGILSLSPDSWSGLVLGGTKAGERLIPQSYKPSSKFKYVNRLPQLQPNGPLRSIGPWARSPVGEPEADTSPGGQASPTCVGAHGNAATKPSLSRGPGR